MHRPIEVWTSENYLTHVQIPMDLVLVHKTLDPNWFQINIIIYIII